MSKTSLYQLKVTFSFHIQQINNIPIPAVGEQTHQTFESDKRPADKLEPSQGMQIPTEAERNLPTTAVEVGETGVNANCEAAHSISDVAAKRGEIIPVSTASESETSSHSDTSTSQSDEKVNFSSWFRALTVQTV